MSRLPHDLDRLLHDLRGPLNAVGMHAEVLKRAVGDDRAAAESVRTIQAEAERLGSMLVAAMSVVAIERTESRRLPLRPVVETALETAKIKDVTVAEGEWPEVVGDAALLQDAVVHLVQNAIDATQAAPSGTPPPEISVERAPDGMAALVVRDHGGGLKSTNPKVLIKLRATTKPGHHGVGLVVVERIARLHGGSLRFESAGVGARVILSLPIAR